MASFETQSVGGGQVGRLYRLKLQYADGSDGPASVIAKLPPLAGPTRDLADLFRMHEREVRFYGELAPEADLPVPRVYGLPPGAPASDVLLMEDVTGAEPGDLLKGCTLDQAAAVVEVIAGMHSRWWDDPHLLETEWLLPPDNDVITRLMRDSAAEAWKRFAGRYRAYIPLQVARVGKGIPKARGYLDTLASRPQTLLHGDMRVNNVFFDSTNSRKVAKLIDWQTVGRGRGPMDIASLFVSSLTQGDRRIAEKELLPEYHDRISRTDARYSFDECWLDYRLAVVAQFQQVVMLHEFAVGAETDDRTASVTGGRLIAAIQDLDLAALSPRLSVWDQTAYALEGIRLWIRGSP